jgi:hypothetical protein
MFKKLRKIAKTKTCRSCYLLDKPSLLRDVATENRK